MKGENMTEYSLKACRIQSEYEQLDDMVDKKLWLKEQIDQLEKEYRHELKLFQSNFRVVFKELMDLLAKGDK